MRERNVTLAVWLAVAVLLAAALAFGLR